MRPSTRSARSTKRRPSLLPARERCRRKFLHFFPGGFHDPTYLEWERDYKWATHLEWEAALGREEFGRLETAGRFEEIASRALRIEQRSRHSMIFSFEKMALGDAVRSAAGARAFSEGLYRLLHGEGRMEERFNAWVETVASLGTSTATCSAWRKRSGRTWPTWGRGTS